MNSCVSVSFECWLIDFIDFIDFIDSVDGIDLTSMADPFEILDYFRVLLVISIMIGCVLVQFVSMW